MLGAWDRLSQLPQKHGKAEHCCTQHREPGQVETRPGPWLSRVLLPPRLSFCEQWPGAAQQGGAGAEPKPCQRGSFVWGAVRRRTVRRDGGCRSTRWQTRPVHSTAALRTDAADPQPRADPQRQSPGSPRAVAGAQPVPAAPPGLGGSQAPPQAWLRPGHGAAASICHTASSVRRAAPGRCPVPRPAPGCRTPCAALQRPREQALSK